MLTKTVDGVDYIQEEITGKGLCYVPYRKFNEKNVFAGLILYHNQGGERDNIVMVCCNRSRWSLFFRKKTNNEVGNIYGTAENLSKVALIDLMNRYWSKLLTFEPLFNTNK